MNAPTNKKGFTIIEVVLVLAIAGLIFLMVFIALPALQRGQRDNQRKNDISRLQTAVTNYVSANRGGLPVAGTWNTATTGFVATYLTTAGDSFVDPSGAPAQGPGANSTAYVILENAVGSTVGDYTATQNVIYVTRNATCVPTNSAQVQNAGTRKMAFRMALEGGGIYCVNI